RFSLRIRRFAKRIHPCCGEFLASGLIMITDAFGAKTRYTRSWSTRAIFITAPQSWTDGRYNGGMIKLRCISVSVLLLIVGFAAAAAGQSLAPPAHPIVLHAVRLLDLKNGRIVKPGEVWCGWKARGDGF
ncbi:MAG: hypothetical protein WB566_03665, partial [Terriglobales bacterium]